MEGCSQGWNNFDAASLVDQYRKGGTRNLISCLDQTSLLLYDPEEKTLFVGRDCQGVGIFYMRSVGEIVRISPSIHSLFDVEEQINLSAIGIIDYLTFQFVRAPYTVVEGVSKLSAGEYRKFESNDHVTCGRKPVIQYTGIIKDYNKAVKEFELLIDQVYEDHAKSLTKQHCALFYSGGIDSSTNLFNLHNKGVSLSAITASFSEIGYDEAPIAMEITGDLNVPHRVVNTKIMHMQEVSSIVSKLREPNCDRAILPSVNMMRDHIGFDVIVSGEGGDEIFEFSRRTPWSKTSNYSKHEGEKDIIMYLKGLDIFSIHGREELLTKKELVRERYLETVKELFNDAIGSYPISKAQLLQTITLGTWLPENVVNKDLGVAKNINLPVLFPLTDARFLQFIGSLTPEVHSMAINSKNLLKHALKKYNPLKVLEKEKTKFKVPYQVWFSEEMINYIKIELVNNPIFHDTFDREGIEKITELIDGSQKRVLFGLFVLIEWVKGVNTKKNARY